MTGMDQADQGLQKRLEHEDFILISASQKKNIQELKDKILSHFQINQVKQGDVLVTNLRHYQSLKQTDDSLSHVLTGMDDGITRDFLAMDIRQALHYLGEITGQVTTEDLLANIFSKYNDFALSSAVKLKTAKFFLNWHSFQAFISILAQSMAKMSR